MQLITTNASNVCTILRGFVAESIRVLECCITIGMPLAIGGAF